MTNQTSTPAKQAHTLHIDNNSVGIVTPEVYHFDEAIDLECGRSLPEFDLVVETYGELNADKSNAILICHALSGSHHAAGFHSTDDKKPGWWDTFIGPNKPIDTNKFFVVCLNNIGSCYGSTGPTSINPESLKNTKKNQNQSAVQLQQELFDDKSDNNATTNKTTNTQSKAYASDFPMVTIKDWVKTQAILSDRLGIDVWYAMVGGSMGGMQVLQWSVDYPERLKKAVIIASTPKLSAQNIAFNEVARQSILTDPDFHNGDYLTHKTMPKRGLVLARMVGHITYLTDEAMKHKFGRDLKVDKFKYGYGVEFQVESYLRYQGESFSKRFDANTYLLMTKALDYFDPTRDYVAADSELSEAEALTATLAHTQCQFLIVSFTTDWRFTPERSQEIVNALIANDKPVSYVNIDAPYGHDSFLFDIPRYNNAVRNFLHAGLKAEVQSTNYQSTNVSNTTTTGGNQ